jgi:hypothetical protein
MDFVSTLSSNDQCGIQATIEGGEGYSLVGHHEIMFPLLAAAVIERLEGNW